MSPLYHRALSTITLLSALGCAVIGGTFFAFSTFVMPALARLPASQGIGAMQSINVVVLNRWFLGVFLGTALACVVLSVASSVRGPAWLSIAGSLLYLVGSLGITKWFNVPLNDKYEITDDTRIRAAVPTIKKILKDGGSVILMSHLGRPKDGPTEKYSLKHLVPHLQQLLGVPVEFATDCIGEPAAKAAAALKPGQVNRKSVV